MDSRGYPLFDDDDEADEFLACEVDGEGQEVPYGYAVAYALSGAANGASSNPFIGLYRFTCEPEMVEPTWSQCAAGLKAVQAVLAVVRADPAVVPICDNWVSNPFGPSDFRADMVKDLGCFERALLAGHDRGVKFYLRVEN